MFSFLATFVFAATVQAAEANPLALKMSVEKYQLQNGLTVLLMEDHSVPMISYHTWYKVGSRDERDGVTGSAHMLEHMMFQGAKKYSGKQFSSLMQENGIEWNAFTTYDYTGFHMNLPSSKLEMVMDVEQDRMSSLALDPKNLQSEREVVKEERRWRVDNNPQGSLLEVTMSTVFPKSPYHWPIVGWMKDIEKFDVAGLRAFYESYYVPNNAVLVIAGDIDKARVRALVDKYYSGLPRKEVPARPSAVEAAQTVQYNVALRKEIEGTHFNVAFQSVPEMHEDGPALDLAATILSAGSSSRLYRRMVYQKELATGVSVASSSMKEAGVFTVGVSLKPGQQVGPALEIVYNEIYKLRTTMVSDADLKKAKTISLMGYMNGLSTIDSKAQYLAAMEILTGSYENIFKEVDRYASVTPQDIQRVAKKYLNQKQRSIIVLEPRVKGGQQ